MLKIIDTKDLIIEHSITNNIYKHINQYPTDVFNNYKLNTTHNVKNTYYDCANDVVINKHNIINTNDTYEISKTNKLVDFNGNNLLQRK